MDKLLVVYVDWIGLVILRVIWNLWVVSDSYGCMLVTLNVSRIYKQCSYGAQDFKMLPFTVFFAMYIMLSIQCKIYDVQ